jgi:tetratricopeptide (TPR) repeat protein
VTPAVKVDAQVDEMLDMVSRMGAPHGMPGYRELVADLEAARARSDRGAEASLGLMLGTMLTATARTLAVIGDSPGFPDLPDLAVVNERAIAALGAAVAAAEAAGDVGSERLALLHLADCHLRGASPAQARPLLDGLIDRCDTPDTVNLRYEALSRLGDCDLTLGNAAAALASYKAAQGLAETIGDPAEQASQLGKLASSFAALDQPAKALDHYRRSRELWVQIRDDPAVRDQVVLHAGLLQPGVDPIISDVDKRIRALEGSVRLADSRASLSPRQECHYRTATHCLGLMADLGQRWRSGVDRPATQVAFEEEWGLVRHNQAWAAQHASELEVAAELCLDFAQTGRSLLDTRVAPADRLRWSQAALAVAETRGDRAAQAGVCVNLANDEFDLGCVDDAFGHAEQAYQFAQELNREDTAGSALITLSQVHQLRGRFDLAQDTLEQGRRLLRDSEEADRYLTNQAGLYSATGDFATAVELGTRDLEEAVRAEDPTREASALANLGTAYHGLGEFQTGLDYEERAIALFRKLGDRRAEVEVLANSAASRLELGDFDEAERLLRTALARARGNGYRQGEEGALGNLAVVLRNTGRHDEAAALFTEAMGIARERGHLAGQAAALHGLASVEFERGNYDGSAELFQRSLDIAREMKHPEVTAKAALGLGQVAIMKRDLEAALGSLSEALDLARQAGNRHLEANVRQVLELANRLETTTSDGEGRPPMDIGEQLYRNALSAVPYLRRDGVTSYFERTQAATGDLLPTAIAGDAESGLALFKEALETSEDEETQQKYSVIFGLSVRRAAEDVAATGAVDPASLADSDDLAARVLGMMVAIRALARFPADLTAVIRALAESQPDA